MKFYNPFKAHVVYDNYLKCYRIRRFRIFGFEYIERSRYENRTDYYWHITACFRTKFYSEESAIEYLEKYRSHSKTKRFSVK